MYAITTQLISSTFRGIFKKITVGKSEYLVTMSGNIFADSPYSNVTQLSAPSYSTGKRVRETDKRLEGLRGNHCWNDEYVMVERVVKD